MKAVLLDQILAVLTEIRDLLKARPLPGRPLGSMPYEQLAAVMERFDGPTAGAGYTEAAPPLQTDPVYGYDVNAMASAIPLPPARPAGSLHSVNDLPDRSANPGAINPDVTQQNMATTIFVSGFTKTIRPSVGFTNALKVQQLIEYGYPPNVDPSLFEEDHIVPLECGGAPHDEANLWPQPRTGGDWNARVKDLTENAANAALRTGAMSLSEVQQGFMADWKALHMRLFTNPKVVASMMMMTMEPPEDEP